MLPLMAPDAAGIDIGATEIWVAVPGGSGGRECTLICKFHARPVWVGRLAGAVRGEDRGDVLGKSLEFGGWGALGRRNHGLARPVPDTCHPHRREWAPDAPTCKVEYERERDRANDAGSDVCAGRRSSNCGKVAPPRLCSRSTLAVSRWQERLSSSMCSWKCSPIL